MSIVVRRRTLRPSTRRPDSPYKINTRNVTAFDTLQVLIDTETNPGKIVAVYEIDGIQVAHKNAIAFRAQKRPNGWNIRFSGAKARLINGRGSPSYPALKSSTIPISQPSPKSQRLSPRRSNLTPFLRHGLDLLFVGLNPAMGSSLKGHYFSVNNAFWDQLFEAGLITEPIDKSSADETVFGGTSINFRDWNYGITDLVPHIAESRSQKVKPTRSDCVRLKRDIQYFQPRAICILHRRVQQVFLPFIGAQIPPYANPGQLGRVLKGTRSTFFAVAFPHGNPITSEEKVEVYIKIRNFLAGKGKES